MGCLEPSSNCVEATFDRLQQENKAILRVEYDLGMQVYVTGGMSHDVFVFIH